MEEPLISIIIPVLNQVEKLDECLKKLSSQLNSVSDIEVMVVDNESTDGSQLVAEKYNFSTIHLNGNQNPYLARNKGALLAKGGILVFLDAKCIPSENYISEIKRICLDPNWDVVSGDFDFIGLSSKSSFSELAYAVMYLRTNPKYHDGEITVLTGNMMVRKSVFLELGQFDTKRSGGDVRFSKKAEKANKVKIFEPNLKVSYTAKRYKDLIHSVKRDIRDLRNVVPWYSVRPAGSKYLTERLADLNIEIGSFTKMRLKFFIMYLRFIKYWNQA